MDVSGKLFEEAGSKLCQICKLEEKSKHADGFCENCDEYMCNSCFQDHLKPKPCRRHLLGPLSQGITRRKQEEHCIEKCKKHVKETLKYYCRRHDAVTCGDCNVLDHKGCDVEFIRDIAKNFRESSELKDILGKIERLESTNAENERQQQINDDESKTSTKRALKEIKQFRKDLNDYLDQAEEEITAEVNRLSRENEDLLSDLKKKIKEVSCDLVEMKNCFYTKACPGEKLFIHAVELKQRFVHIEKSVNQIKDRNVIHSFLFTHDQRLNELLQSKWKLGSLETIQTHKDKHTSRKDNQTITNTDTEKFKAPYRNDRQNQKEEPGVSQPQLYSPADPRSKGFDIGKRVKAYDNWNPILGKITAVYPEGYIDVHWDNGGTGRRLRPGRAIKLAITQ